MTDTPATARKRGRPAAHERDARRDEILRAATTTFLAHGYSATTLDQIATAAQVTKRTVYTYVGDKAAVFTAVVDQLHRDVIAQGAPVNQTGHDADQTPSTTLLDLCTRIVDTLHSDHGTGLHRLVIAEAPGFPDLAATFYATGPERYVAALADALRARGTSTDGALSPGGAPVGTATAESLFGLLLGEAHRRRLLGLTPAPSAEQARAHAQGALDVLGLGEVAST
ncbi:transcriptional regulator [Sanguibacter keddieii DSM 10542]|uniref:Transcriptional regulator n=1 Tax=Sanguibacter keddieii (strain ATCC 51767 / DSM 10542 / NCFB 3025 / ST-74) TaxID=446469 RepID=D1BH87_SANKS|nr:TetR/AcrR family transcriptional regulator [Sanguibacter keddieii]ACZ21807.1 transcriptional regulator [Sanguibacter keddieii DSM 10542]